MARSLVSMLTCLRNFHGVFQDVDMHSSYHTFCERALLIFLENTVSIPYPGISTRKAFLFNSYSSVHGFSPKVRSKVASLLSYFSQNIRDCHLTIQGQRNWQRLHWRVVSRSPATLTSGRPELSARAVFGRSGMRSTVDLPHHPTFIDI